MFICLRCGHDSLLSASELIQIKKYKTFEEICPNWYKVLKYDRGVCRLSILYHGSCIVGEAHGFSSGYMKECNECLKFSEDFVDVVYESDKSELDSLINNFTEHYNNKH